MRIAVLWLFGSTWHGCNVGAPVRDRPHLQTFFGEIIDVRKMRPLALEALQ